MKRDGISGRFINLRNMYSVSMDKIVAWCASSPTPNTRGPTIAGYSLGTI
jgi:hypothetical protein